MKKIVLLIVVIFSSIQIINAQKFKYGKVSKEELQEVEHPVDKEANAAVLYREFDTNFEYTEDDGFYLVTHAYERIKIYNKEGFDWGTKVIPLYLDGGTKEEITNLKGYTYQLDGNGKISDVKLRSDGIFDEKRSKHWKLKKFTMPNLTDGCIIEFKYTIRSPFIGIVDEYRFQETVPVNKSYMRFAAPEYLNYKTHQKGWIPYKVEMDGIERSMNFSYTRKRQRGEAIDSHERTTITFKENIYVVNMQNVPALKEESFMGNINNYSSSLKFELAFTKYPNSSYRSFSHSWDDVSRSINESPSFGGEMKKSNYYKSDIDKLLGGVSNPTEKMMRIYEFVKSRMACTSDYGVFIDEGVKTAYREGKGNVGDINLMLISMFRYAGLKANPVLVSTKNHGIPIYPTRHGFNYVIGGVVLDGKVFLLDATKKDGEVNVLQTRLLNWQGRMVATDGASAWVSLEPEKPAVKNTMISVIIGEDLSIKGTSQSRVTGHYSMKYRDDFVNVSQDDTRKLLEKEKGETEIDNIEFENLKMVHKPIKLSYDFENMDAIEEVGGKLYFSPMLFLARSENPFKSDERKYPIEYDFSRKDRCLISIDLPEGYSVESIPESASFGLEQNMGSFRYAISENGGKIQLSVELAINEAVIAADAYEGLKRFYQLLIEKENEKIVLSKS